MMLPTTLPALLRAAGLEVIEVDGWETRGRPASSGGFDPVGVLNHHTGASAKSWSRDKRLAYAKWMFLTGRSDLPAPLCQISLGPDGEVYLGAAGRANHAGTAKSSGSVGAGDGNRLYIGIEWMLSGTESIPPLMRAAGVTLNAVLTEKVTKTSVETVSCHYNTSITGKWDIGDPSGVDYRGVRVLDIKVFRKQVQAARDRLYGNDDLQGPRGPQGSSPGPVNPQQPRAEYAWFQAGSIGESTSGCAIGVRREFGALLDGIVIEGSDATSEGKRVTGKGIGKRTILRASVKAPFAKGQMAFPVAAGHAPPKRAPKARAQYMKAFAGVSAPFKGGDLNLARRAVESLLGRKVVGGGVLWLTVPRAGWKVVSVRRIDVDGDHEAILARVRNTRTDKIVRILVINCMSVSTGAKHAATILANGLSHKPDIVLASECADFRAAQVDASSK